MGWSAPRAPCPDDPRGDPARHLRGDRDAYRISAARPVQGTDEAAAHGQQRRAPVQRRAVPHVVRQLALHPAGAGPLATAYGAHLPADDPDDHARRLARRPTRGPLRRAPRPRKRAHHVDGRNAAAREDRRQRQRGRLRDDPGGARGGGDRHVDRALDHRRHPGRQGGAGRARVGPGEHLAPGGRWARARRPDNARHAAQQPSHRHRRGGTPGADRGVPPGLPDRRRSGRRGGACSRGPCSREPPLEGARPGDA